MKIALVAVVVMLGIPAHAANEIFANTGYRMSNKEWKGGVYGDVGAFFGITEYLDLGGSAGMSVSDNKVKTMSKGETRAMPMLARIRIKGPWIVSPFVDVGGGMFLFEHELDKDVTNFCSVLFFKCEEDLEHAIGGSFGGGVRGNITDNIVVGLSAYYWMVKPKLKTTVTDLLTGRVVTNTNTVNLSSMVAGANIAIRF